jgi:2'-5' RNA ligase
MDSARWRLFVAIPVPEVIRARLAADLGPYRSAFAEARWLDPATWHLTLVFIGSVAAARVGEVAAVCDGAGDAWAPFVLDLVAGDGHVRRGEGVAWLSARRSAGRVLDIASAIQRGLGREVHGLPEPRRATSAHLTVARRADARLVAALRAEALGPLRAEWPVDRIEVMRSHLGRAGASYETLHGASLRGALEA